MGPATMTAPPTRYGGPTSAIPAYQYGPPDEGYEEDRRGRRWWPWVLGLLVVLAAIGAVAYLLLAGNKTYAVPQVQGDPQAKAVSAVKSAHLVPKVVKQPNGAVPSGHVITSRPPFGNLVPAHTVVTLYVSTGPKLVNVPNVVGQNVSQAQNTLSSKGLTSNVRTNANSTQPAGTVIKQNPLAGTGVKPGSSVTIVVSGGGVRVPNEIGQSLQVARAALQGDGLSSAVTYVPASGGTAPGTVVGMKPGPGTAVAKGTTITLQVAHSQPTTPPPSPSTSPPPSSSPPSPSPSHTHP
jgi:serine/threonine-protein kinase